MQIGDKIPVMIAGHVVAEAQIRELADGTATLTFPATQVIMGVSSNLTDLPTQAPSTETIIDGVDASNSTQEDGATVGDVTQTVANPVPDSGESAPAAPVAEVSTPEAPQTPAEVPETPAVITPAPEAQNISPEPTEA